jgi:cytosine permease
MMSTILQKLSRKEAAEAPASAQDYTSSAVPASERRDPVTMGLLWITMVTGFPSVLVGFQWFKAGLNLPQVIGCSIVSCIVLLLYALPASMMGSNSGLTYALLARKVFGRWGSLLVSLNLLLLSIAWYGLTAVFLAAGLEGLFHWHLSPIWFSALLAIVMTFNNFFGFSGVANFARYLAGPVLVAWVFFTFCKAGVACPASVWTEPGHIGTPLALGLVSSFVIGYSVWGNEADYWRFGKPKLWSVTIPILVSLSIGEFIFPITGWMLARQTGVTGDAAATSLMNTYAFGGWSAIAAAVLVVTYMAVNDSMLYGCINALENFRSMNRRKVVAFLAFVGSVTAAFLAGVSNNFEQVAALSAVFLPSATIVILVELWLISKEHKEEGRLSQVPSLADLHSVRWSAVLAFACGCAVGLVTANLVPGLQKLSIGVPALNAWIATFVSYVIFRNLEKRLESKREN